MHIFDVLKSVGKEISTSRGDEIFAQGSTDRSVYFMQAGLAKAVYLSADGTEHVKSFLTAGEFMGSLTACHSEQPCSFSLVCLEESTLHKIAFDQLRAMSADNMEMAQFVINGLLELAMKKERREFEFLTLTAEERFLLFRKRNPDLIEKVTQNDIARYLGITPVALSRIKKRTR